MFLFAFIQSVVSHVAAFARKSYSTAADLLYLKRIHKNFARINQAAPAEGSGVEYSAPSSGGGKSKKWLHDVMDSEKSKKTQDWKQRSSRIRTRIRSRKGGAQARWVGGR